MYSYKQGFYNLKNPNKYIFCSLKLDNRPFFRSSYEERLFTWADYNSNVIKWCSECLIIKYKVMEWNKKLQKHILKEHKYYTDLYCEILTNDNKIIKYVIEIKPSKQTEEPTKPKRKTKKSQNNYLNEMAIWQKNSAKWEAAIKYCQENGLIFKLITDKDIFK